MTGPGDESSIWEGRLLPITLANLTIIALAAFDGLAVTAALPAVAEDLGDVALLPWVITAYLAASSVAVIVAGPLIDGFGVRRTFRLTAVWFGVTSGLCAAAPTLPLLVAARAAQGLGGGLVIAVAWASVGIAYPERLRARAFAANSMVWGVLGLGGPAIAAGVLEVSSWRAIFVIQVPLTLIAVVAGWRSLPSTRERPVRPRTDVRGVVLVTAVTLVALVSIAQIGVRWVVVGATAAGTVVLLVGYWVHSGRVAEPVVFRRHLGQPPLRHAHLVSALVLAAVLSVDSYLPLYLNASRGWSIGAAAFAVVFVTVGWSGGSVLASRLLDRRSAERVVFDGARLVVVGLVAATAAVALDAPAAVLLGVYVLMGLGVGLSTTANLTLVQAATAMGEMGRVNAAHQYVRTLGITYGVAIGGAVLLSVVDLRIGDVEVVREVLAGEDVALGADAREAVEAGFAWAHAIGAALAALAVVVAVGLARRSGDLSLRGFRRTPARRGRSSPRD